MMNGQTGRDPYFNPKRLQIILSGVLLVHVGVIVIPMIYSSLTEYFDPPLVVMKVGLADLPLGDSPDAGASASAPEATSDPDPVSVDDIPDPKQVDALPPEKKIEPPPKIDTPPPKPKDDPKPVVTPPKPKDDPKTTVKPKDPPKQTKTETKTDPPKSNLLTADKINVKTNTKSQAQIDAERKAREAAEAKAKADAKARQDALAALRDAAAGTQQGRYGTTNPGQDGILATKEMRDYYEQLNTFIRPKWNAVSPSSVELNGSISNWPVIELTIEKDGRIRSAVVVSKSGNKKIDDAVEMLRADLKAVPVPPQAVKIRVTLDIR